MRFRLLRQIWPLVVSNVLALLIAGLCMNTLSAMRAFVGGESLWSKAQKDSVAHLQRYARDGDPAEYERFRADLAIAIGDRVARLEADKPTPDLAAAYAGLRAGGNHPDDIPGMIRLLRIGDAVPYMRRALAIWAQADVLIDELAATAAQLHEAMTGASLDGARRAALVARIQQLDLTLRPLEDKFSYAIGDASRTTTSIVELAAALSTVLLLTVGVILSRAMMRREDRVSAELRRKNSLLLTQQETSLDAMLLVDEHGSIFSYNRKFVEMWGISEEMVRAGVDAPVLQAVVGQIADAAAFVARVQDLNEHRQERSREEIRTKDGRTIDRFTAPVMTDVDEYYGRVWYFRDITAQVRAESSMRRSNRALRVLIAVNQARILGESERTLLALVCKVLIDPGGYSMAWIGFAEQDAARSVRVVAQRGDDGGFLDRLDISWADVPNGRGPTGTALRTGTVQICRDIASDPRMLAWRDDALEQGYAASISLPLAGPDGVFGVLSIYSKDIDAFDDEELALLQELSADLVFGVLTHRSYVERLRAEAQVERLVNFDPVTGLPNRGRLIAHVEGAIRQARLQETSMALMTIGLDRFSDIQEGMGIAEADEVMKHVAQRLAAVVGGGNFLARASAESFAVVIPFADTARAHDIAIRVQLAMNEPLEYAGIPLVVQATNGVALFPEHGDDAVALMRRSDIAIRQARAADTAYALYSGKGESESPQRLKLLAQLRQAIRSDELVLYSQPKIDVRSGAVAAVEALLRWPNPAGGMTPPDRFIPLAESTGLIKPITRWVLDAACKQILRWQELGLEMPVAINVSPANLRDPDFLDQLVALHSRKGARLDLLQVEVTETALITDPAKAHVVLERIRDLGIHIYIDDFGTGYSSLSYIATLPIHALKIDRSFILGMMRHARHRSVVAASISLAHTLGLKVVAEGIETIEQARAVINLGCDEIQGYLFTKPLPADEFLGWNAAFDWEQYGLHATIVP